MVGYATGEDASIPGDHVLHELPDRGKLELHVSRRRPQSTTHLTVFSLVGTLPESLPSSDKTTMFCSKYPCLMR